MVKQHYAQLGAEDDTESSDDNLEDSEDSTKTVVEVDRGVAPVHRSMLLRSDDTDQNAVVDSKEKTIALLELQLKKLQKDNERLRRKDEENEKEKRAADKDQVENDNERRLEAHVSALDRELDEKISLNKHLIDRDRKNQLAMEQMIADLQTERSAVREIESHRLLLEQKNKELEAKLAELEAAQANIKIDPRVEPKASKSMSSRDRDDVKKLEEENGALEEKVLDLEIEKQAAVTKMMESQTEMLEMGVRVKREHRQKEELKKKLESLEKQLQQACTENAKLKILKENLEHSEQTFHKKIDDLQKKLRLSLASASYASSNNEDTERMEDEEI